VNQHISGLTEMILPPAQMLSPPGEERSLQLVQVHRRQTCRDVSDVRISYTAVAERRLGERQRKWQLQKKTGWLLRL
jgi:hypothetical protein